MSVSDFLTYSIGSVSVWVSPRKTSKERVVNFSCVVNSLHTVLFPIGIGVDIYMNKLVIQEKKKDVRKEKRCRITLGSHLFYSDSNKHT
jgi:hypothetical protein